MHRLLAAVLPSLLLVPLGAARAQAPLAAPDVLIAAGGASADGHAGHAMDHGGHGDHGDQGPVDLTDLSLEQLLDVDITPVNVLGSHTHLKGQWMLGYRFMYNAYNGQLDGDRRVDDQQVLQRYPTSHTRMLEWMHMFEAMYAPSDRLSLMAMMPKTEMWMSHLHRNGAADQEGSSGWGDLTLMALDTLHGSPREQGNRWILNAGISLPTGSINQFHMTENGLTKFEYPMQIGSGTYDLMPGITYLGDASDWSWGGQILGTVRLGRNESGYRLGDRLHLSAWAYYKVTDWFGPSGRLDYEMWGNIRGRDPQIDPTVNPAFDPSKQEGRRLDAYLGLNLYAPRGPLKGHRVALELGVPLYQWLAGPNPKLDWHVNASWTYTFGQ